MPEVNSTAVGYSSSTNGVNKWKKEPCLEHGDKNLVEGLQTPKDLIVFTIFQLR